MAATDREHEGSKNKLCTEDKIVQQKLKKEQTPLNFKITTVRKRERSEDENLFPKQQRQDGLSWWTCLMLDIPQENRRGMKVSIYHQK